MILAALLLAAVNSASDVSRQLTASAEELLQVEQRIAANTKLRSNLYEDVLTLLDSAIEADPNNAHAHALSAGVLLLKSDNGDGTYDICYLLDARDEAKQVLTHASRGSAADLASAYAVLRDIAEIPSSAIPDPPSSCDDKEEQSHGARARFRAR